MRTTTKNSKRLIAFSATAIMALGLTLPGAVRANAYTVDEAAEFTKEVRTPDSLAPMTRQGFRSEAGIVDPNFQDASVSVIPRDQYGGPWSFSHQDEIGGADAVADYSSAAKVTVSDAVEGMGEVAGAGNLITTALEITINKDNQQTLPDSLTYSTFDDLMYGEVAKEAFYYTAWIKAEQDMWFDVGISYGALSGEAAVYWDLGRRFFVPAGEWTQIGIDEDGNYLPFRAKVTDSGFMRGTGSDPTAENSNCATAETYANESVGDTQIEKYYRDSWGGVWACLRLYAYAGSVYEATDGVGAPSATSGLSAGDKYQVTGVNFWNQSAQPYTPVIAVEEIELDKTEATMKVGETLQLQATVSPENAADTTIYWTSGDETIATVDQTGKITAIKAGTVTIYADANDGNGAQATCTVTVTAQEQPPATSSDDDSSAFSGSSASSGGNAGNSDGGSGCGSAIGIGSAAVVTIIAGAVLVSRRRRN